MDVYKWLITLAWLQISAAATSIPPESKVVQCTSHHVQATPTDIFGELASKFCSYAADGHPINSTITIERSYLRNGTWHTFYIKRRWPCPVIFFKSIVKGDACKSELNLLRDLCKFVPC